MHGVCRDDVSKHGIHRDNRKDEPMTIAPYLDVNGNAYEVVTDRYDVLDGGWSVFPGAVEPGFRSEDRCAIPIA